MESSTTSINYPLSFSSNKALAIAQFRAETRSSPVKVSSIDLLVGIMISHNNYSEPQKLIEYANVPLSRCWRELKQDGGFPPDDENNKKYELFKDKPREIDNSEEVEAIFRKAEELAHENSENNDIRIHIAYLFGGIIMTDNAANILLDNMISFSSLRIFDIKKTYREYLKTSKRNDVYHEFLQSRHPVATFTGYNYDLSGKKNGEPEIDLVGIGPEVNALAYLIAYRDLIPPLAIGLFGDWGSGKSFFMQALKQRIFAISENALQAGIPQKEIAIFKHVVQIEFNAWHYVEGELWASLAEHIFCNLQSTEELVPSELQQRKNFWINKLRSAETEKNAIEALTSELDKNLIKKYNEIKDTEIKLKEKRCEQEKITREEFWACVKKSVPDEIQINKALKSIGLKDNESSPLELLTVLKESSEILKRGHAVFAAINTKGWQGVIWTLLFILVLLVGPVLLWILSKFDSSITLKGIATAACGFTAALTTIATSANKWVSSKINKLENARKIIEEKRNASENSIYEELIQLRMEQSKLETQLNISIKEAAKKQEEIRDIEKELAGITPGSLLLDFISERVGSDDYRKHLGVPAMIRRDFDRLSKLINESNKNFINNDGYTSDESVEKQEDEDKHRINRIVLYIDDLDRCPPKRVIEVLQAVHLLLAFPLFVVVVAVDSRWLTESLRSHYSEVLGGGINVNSNDQSIRHASPYDYLEKIFQIPFWVKQLPESARWRIVHNLVRSGTEPMGNQESLNDNQNEAETKKAEGRRQVLEWNHEEGERPLDRNQKNEVNPKGLSIDDDELAFMEELKELLGRSPRSVKRFVNVYRLIKASEYSRGTVFTGNDDFADYKLILFLLSVVTGMQTISRDFFKCLERKKENEEYTLGNCIDELNSLVELQAMHFQTGSVDEISRLKKWVERHNDNSWKTLPCFQLIKWAPRVARFSYRIETLI